MKKSRETFKKYDQEIKNLDKVIARHESTKRDLNKKNNKKKKEQVLLEEEVQKM